MYGGFSAKKYVILMKKNLHLKYKEEIKPKHDHEKILENQLSN